MAAPRIPPSTAHISTDIYGLGAMGEAGVRKALEIIHKELDLTMAFCGRSDINAVDRGILLAAR